MANLDPQTSVMPYSDALLLIKNNATKINALAAAAPAAALTAQLTTITFTPPGTPDYAIQDLTDTGGFGFTSHDEGNTVLKVIANLQTRVAELEARLKTTLALIS
jgi:hypothetical protein